MPITPKHVEVRYTYTIDGEETVRDPRRSVFTPTEATVYKRDGKTWLITVKGPKVKNGHMTETSFRVLETAHAVSVANDERDVMPPQWVDDLAFAVSTEFSTADHLRFPPAHTS